MPNNGIVFTIAGRIGGKARPRPGRRAWYVPTQEMQNDIAWHAQVAMKQAKLAPFLGPVAIDLEIIAKGFARSDIDNLLKLVMDAGNGVVYADDRQVIEAHVRRVIGDRDELRVKVWPIA